MNHTLNPVIDQNSKILILGSFPSVKSREKSFYYMHSTNRFWPLLEMIFKDDFTVDNRLLKKNLLFKYQVALYDVIAKCEIEGSSDASIDSVQVHDIYGLLRGSKIQHIFLNGRLAETLFRTHFPGLLDMATYLPSSSAANARCRLEDLYESWKVIGGYLSEHQ